MVVTTTLALIAGGIAAAIGTGAVVNAVKDNEINGLRLKWQQEREKYQKEIEKLLSEIAEKDRRILQLQQQIVKLDEEKLAETKKRNELLALIESLEHRQRRLESVLVTILRFVLFRYGELKKDRAELKDALAKALESEQNAEHLIALIDAQKETVNGQLQSENENRTALVSSREEMERKMAEMEREYASQGI